MIRNGGNGGGELQAQLVLLVVGQGVDALEDAGNHIVNVVVLHVVVGDDDSAHGHGGGVMLQAVSGGRDDILAVIGGGGDQLLDVSVVQLDHVHVAGGSQR